MKDLMNRERNVDASVANIAIHNPNALQVFAKYNIDYCCGGQQTLEDACHRLGLDANAVMVEIIESTPGNSNSNIRPETWRSSFLIDFIVENHHSYIRIAAQEITALLEKVCERHESENPELNQISTTFSALKDELLNHMDKEELALFPAIKRLETLNSDSNPLRKIVQVPIDAMEEEHRTAGELVSRIRSLTHNYSPPDFACPTFRATYERLKEFEDDLLMHIHLENNILFQRFKPLSNVSEIIS